jgi:glucokinase-like ROK family protein
MMPGNSDFMKQLNRSMVLNVIRNYGPISKVDIAGRTKLTFATVSNIASELTSSKLIYENGYQSSNGGRRSVLYGLDPNSFYVVGVELGVTNIRSVAINLKAEVISDFIVETQSANGREAMLQNIFFAIDEVMTNSKIDRAKFAGIGISSPGPVDPDSGIVLTPPNLNDWHNVPLKKLIEDRYRLPSLLEKDANAAAFGEYWLGAAHGKRNAIYVLADHGIGGGILIDGRIYRGFLNGAGEIGHGTIDIDGRRCNCGNYGCLEAMASGIAIVKRAIEEVRRGAPSSLSELSKQDESVITSRLIINEALNGDKLCKDLLDEAGRYLGIGIASLINYFNPESIILGGPLITTYYPMFGTIETIARQRALSTFSTATIIQQSVLRESASVIGAASLILQYLFDRPGQIML